MEGTPIYSRKIDLRVSGIEFLKNNFKYCLL